MIDDINVSECEVELEKYQNALEEIKEIIEHFKKYFSEEELNNAKNNIIGKQQFVTETNSQQANLMAYYSITDRPYDYQKTIIEALRKVTAEELKICANKYFTDDYVLAILKP